MNSNTKRLEHSQSTTPVPPARHVYKEHPKITQHHLQRKAALYVRQSSMHQLREHQESTARQYQLKDRLIDLGWREDDIQVIDDDLGVSGSGSSERKGFRRLIKLVTDQQVGIVLGLEMSRLARNSKDWHDLFEVCAIFDALIADEDGVFNPNEPNDRLVLGMKGIISELELHTMKVRLERGRLSKAERGQLFHDIPVGFVLNEQGQPELDPDASARAVMHQFFRSFEELGSAAKLFRYLVEHDLKLPFRRLPRLGIDSSGKIHWRLAAATTVLEILKHPLHAGAYGYGRRKNYRKKRGVKFDNQDAKTRDQDRKNLPYSQWKVLIKDLYPGYISWEQYERNQAQLESNSTRKRRTGAARKGDALLAGIVFCSRCGRRMSPWYNNKTSRPSYFCSRHYRMAHVERCASTIVARVLDELVADQVLTALSPATVELSLRAVEQETQRRRDAERQLQHQLQRAEYEVDLATRRYQSVDPANRLVADTLEAQWEHALEAAVAAKTKLDEFHTNCETELTTQERERIASSCQDVTALWQRHATNVERKEIVRLLIERVEVYVTNNTQLSTIAIRWSGGFQSTHELSRPVPTNRQLDYYDAMLQRALELALAGERSPAIALQLAKEGYMKPRTQGPFDASSINQLLNGDDRSRKQLHEPDLGPNQWRAADLSQKLGINTKKLKDWGVRGWVNTIQRPFGRCWIFWADADELQRLRQLVALKSHRGAKIAEIELLQPKPIPRQQG